MKRLFLTVVAVLSMTMTFAEDEKLNNVESAKAYNMEVNYGKLADFLGLSSDQLEAVQDIHTSFCADMLNAANANSDERASMVKYMRNVLTGDQFRKYLMLLNVTFNNRGIER